MILLQIYYTKEGVKMKNKQINRTLSLLLSVVMVLSLCPLIAKAEGEKEGEEYFFTDETELEKFKTEGRLIEERAYNTVYGIWHYFTADDGQFNFEQKNQDYLMIGTLESYEKLKTYFGNEKVVPLYIEVEDGERLTRALAREKTQKEPKYAEMCRRFLADSKDFSEENLAHAGITERYENTNLEDVLEKICKKILEQ